MHGMAATPAQHAVMAQRLLGRKSQHRDKRLRGGVLQAAARCAVESADSVPAALSGERVRTDARLALASLTEWALPLAHPVSML